MTIWILFLGLFTLFFGLLFIFSPKVLTRMSEGLNRMVQEVDSQVMSNRMMVGTVLVILALSLFFYAYKLGIR
jgi:hypothetical protein